jgi:hypothetical protein
VVSPTWLEGPPSVITTTLYGPAGKGALGIFTFSRVLVPDPARANDLVAPPPINWTTAPIELGGEPKFDPLMVSSVPHVAVVGETLAIVGAGGVVGAGVGVSSAAPHAVTVNGTVFEAPPLLTTTRLKLLPATRPLDGNVAVICVFEPPIRLSNTGVPEPGGPPRSCTLVPKLDGGEPKFVPLTVITEPQVPVALAAVIDGIGTGVPVGVAVSVLGVLLGIGVTVGVSVAPMEA